MQLVEYVCIRAHDYNEEQAALARFPEAYWIERGNIQSRFVDFLLPITMREEAEQFVKEINTKERK